MRSIRHLCDHRAELYRESATIDALGDRVITWGAVDVPEGRNCRPNQAWSGQLQDHGPGEQQGALRQWFLLPDFPAQERDVLKVTEGPEAGTRLKVMSVTRPTGRMQANHLEVNVEVWFGSAP